MHYFKDVFIRGRPQWMAAATEGKTPKLQFKWEQKMDGIFKKSNMATVI